MKSLVILVLSFVLGFLTHAFFFPDILANGIADVSKLALPPITPTTSAGKVDPLMTTISFDGQKFSRHNVTIQFSRYIQIINQSPDKLMWLTSNNPLLATPRGYSTSEKVEARMDKKGQFIVTDKNNPQEKLVITVK